MTSLSELGSGAFEAARSIASAKNQRLTASFDNTLTGDLARFQVRRHLLRRFPDAPKHWIEIIVQECLTP